MEAVHVPAHLAPPGSLQAKQPRHLHAQLSLGQSRHRQNKTCIYAHRVASVSDSSRPCRLWPARLLCQGGRRVFQARILEHFGQYWLPSPSKALFPAALAANSLEYLMLRTPVTQAAAPPPHLALTGANPSPPGQPQKQTPVEDPHAEEEIKPQLKPMGSVDKEEDPKPSYQLYQLQIKSKRSTRQTVSMEYRKGHRELPQKKMH